MFKILGNIWMTLILKRERSVIEKKKMRMMEPFILKTERTVLRKRDESDGII